MIKNLFSTPKKTAVTVLCALAILTAVGTGTAFAVSAVAESTSIGADKAKMFAFADAGVDPVAAENVRTEFDFEQGHFIYDVEFTANGTEYGYWIQASDGSVVKKKIELIGAGGSKTGITAAITQKDARKIALEDAGLTEAEVTISAEKLDTENGVAVYEVDFVKGNVKYEYDINATTGAVYSKSSESTAVPTTEAAAQPSEAETAAASEAPKAENRSNNNYIGLERAKAIALSDAGLSAASVTFTEAKQDFDDGVPNYDLDFYTATHEYDYEINAQTGAIMDKSVEVNEHAVRETKPAATAAPTAAPTAAATEAARSFIGVDRAKSIALGHAGVSASSVSFSKAKLDDDDGRGVYEIEFYVGNTEYDYEIDAYSGGIIEYDKDRD
ncbi:PepSY domain-containing protein [Stomatobaculum longum]|uniref:PepSY domain-containing protein n=1 Tax=Stomatobaculum longum TaxID=796942 RepID=UPI0028D020EE|nr:PepSY domain-containing protein [Stomatobaculum longum]